jgi:putative signal transducing protein
VVTLRTYWNFTEAALAKSVLDEHEIFCALFHENAHLYGRAPIAMPVRLMVVEDQADRALRILAGDFSGAAGIEEALAIAPARLEPEGETAIRSDRPWELLVMAFYFFVPAICVLQITYPATLRTSGWGRYLIAKVVVFHFLSWLSIVFALSLVALFCCAGRHSRRASESGPDGSGPHSKTQA